MKDNNKIDFYKDWQGLGEPHNEKDAPKGWGTLDMNEEHKIFTFTGSIVKPKRSRLTINGGDLVIETNKPLPNIWYRFWSRFLLGWKWERIE